jgi:hypothetical protein
LVWILALSTLVSFSSAHSGSITPDAKPTCGEPLYQVRNQALFITTPEAHPDQKKLARYFSAMSQSNLAELEATLAPFSEAEIQIMRHLQGRQAKLIHRIPAEKFLGLLDSEALLSPREAEKQYGLKLPPFTPLLEDQLFGGHHCVFATAGPPDGRPRYGDVKITIKNNTGQFVWASPSSGWFFATVVHGNVNPFTPDFGDQLRFSHQVIVEEDFVRYFQFMTLIHLRSREATERTKLSEKLLATADTDQLYQFIDEEKLGYLEAKFFGFVPFSQLESIEVPASLKPAVQNHPHYPKWAGKIRFND